MSAVVARRDFLRSSAAASTALLLPFYLSGKLRERQVSGSSATGSFSPNAWLEVSPEGDVKIWCGKSEMGQGVRTALPMIVADELSCGWHRVQVVQADLDAKYGNQLTAGSGSLRRSYSNLRKAGAAARQMPPSPAAAQRHAPRPQCHPHTSLVIHA